VYTVRGRVVPAERVSLRLDESRNFSTGEDGRFEFEGVAPGAYEIRTNSVGSPLVGRSTIVVADADLDDIVIRLGSGAAISGLVKGMSSGQVAIGEASADIKPDGGFEFVALLPGVHPIEISGLPEGSYVRAINFAGKAIDDWRLDLTSGTGGELLILVSPDAGEIAGVVPNAPGALVQVWPAGGDTARSVRADARGGFRVHSAYLRLTYANRSFAVGYRSMNHRHRSLNSASSSSDSRNSAAPMTPSTCSADRIPTMAAVTSGRRSTQAIATSPGVRPCRCPIKRSRSASSKFRDRLGS